MYILKNALRSIGRSKGRNLLLGIIALVIAVSACIGLSIRQAAESARESTLASLNVTATISYDRSSAMSGMQRPEEGEGFPSGSFDKDAFAELMGNASSLTLEEYMVYAEAPSVEDFYYTVTAYLNGSEDFEAVTSDAGDLSEGKPNGFPGGMMGGMGGFSAADGDFTIVGYSSDSAMTEFMQGNASVAEGSVFEQGTEEYHCIVSEELAVYNSLSVGSEILFTNPANEEETYTFTVTGIYTSSTGNDFSMSMFGASQDPANRIYVSAAALQKLLDVSAENSQTVTDEDTGSSYETALSSTLSATYVLGDVESYYAFESEVRDLGLSDSYAVSSTDISSFENSLTPLETLSEMAGWFLLVILAIGAVILVVLNILNIRERKYEIGVLTAMGMKKGKVALQFLCEILVITMVAIVLGALVGAVTAVPVTNTLLANQEAGETAQQDRLEQSFGRPGGMGDMGGMGNMGGGMPSMDMPSGGGFFEEMAGGFTDYVTEVDSAMNLTVVLQMLGIGLLLTLIASAVSVLFVMRYDPLRILSNRD